MPEFIIIPRTIVDSSFKELSFEEKDETAQGNTKGAYWCEGCCTWQLPVGHDEHMENCDCNY